MRSQRDCYERRQVPISQQDPIEPANPEEIKRYLDLWEASSNKTEPGVNNSRSNRSWVINRLTQLYRFIRKVLTNKR